MVCGNFILPEPASYVFFYALFLFAQLIVHYPGTARGQTDSAQYAVLCFPMNEYVCKLGGFSGSDSLEFRKGNSGAGKN